MGMRILEKNTVSMYFVGAAVARLADGARDRVLRTAGVAPDLLATPHARVPAASFAALWLAVAQELDDEFFGLDSRRMKVGSFALLSQAVLNNGNLDRALRGIAKGFSVFLDDIDAELSLDGEHAVVTVSNRIAALPQRRFAEETLLVMVHGLMCWLAGRRIPLTLAEFAYPRPLHAQEYTAMYSQNLRFDAACTSVRFDARLLNAPVVQNAATLRHFLRSAPQSVFLKYRNEDSWTARLRRRLRGSIGSTEWPSLQDIAAEFNITSTTLRRRLEAEGTSYQGIKDELRRDIAIDRLCNGSLSIAEIAGLLGFQETSAFHRAFKKWNGIQPGEYRAQNVRGSMAAVAPQAPVLAPG